MVAFLVNSVGGEIAGAMERPDPRFSVPGEVMPKNSGDLAIKDLHLPASLGEIKKLYTGTNGKTVINIQDSHCNYSCQKNINLIFDLLSKKTNVDTALIEGGAGEYDLSVFTDMKDPAIREKVADYFMKEGKMNGAEYFAVNNPGRVTLKGLEDEKAYRENLRIYRDNLPSKDKAERTLKGLSDALSVLRVSLYTPAAAAIDKAESCYSSGQMDIKEYVSRLAAFAKDAGITAEKYGNLDTFMRLVREEKEIDFVKAEKTRLEIIDDVMMSVSSGEAEKLTANMMLVNNGGMAQSEFYGYLFNKARTASIDVDSKYPDLMKYAPYAAKNESIDRGELIFEIENFTGELFYAACRTATERELFAASGNLSILKDLFNITLTRTHYGRFADDRKKFSAGYLGALILRASRECGVAVTLPPDINELDGYVDRMAGFYEASFKRDDFFVERIGECAGDKEVVIVVSGGFHAENMGALLKEKGYSYITVLPAFDPKEETPYFRLLSGGEVKEEKSVTEAISSIAISGMLSDFKDDPGYFYKNELMIRLREARESARPLIVNVCDKNWQLERKILFRVENGEYVREDFPAVFLKKQLVNPIRLELRVSRNNKILAMREMNGTYINDPGLDDGLSLRERGKKENHTTMPGHGNISRGDPLELYEKFLEQGDAKKLTIWQRIKIYFVVMGLKNRIDISGLDPDMKTFLKEKIDYTFRSAKFVTFRSVVLKDPDNALSPKGWLFGFNTLYEENEKEIGIKKINGYLNEKYPATIGFSEELLGFVGDAAVLQEYLFHEFLCPLMGHEKTRTIQEGLFPENYDGIIGDNIPGHKDGELSLVIQNIIWGICEITIKDRPVSNRQYIDDLDNFKRSSFLDDDYIGNLRFYEVHKKWTEFVKFASKLGQSRMFKQGRDVTLQMNDIIKKANEYVEAKMKWLAIMDPIWKTGSVLGDKRMEELSRDTQSEIRREAIEIVTAHKEFFRENPGYAFLLKDRAIIKAMAYIYSLAEDEREWDAVVWHDEKPFSGEIERIGGWEQSKLWQFLMIAKDVGRDLYEVAKYFTNVKWLGIVSAATLILFVLVSKIPALNIVLSPVPLAFLLGMKKGEIRWQHVFFALFLSAEMVYFAKMESGKFVDNAFCILMCVPFMFGYITLKELKRYLKSRCAAEGLNTAGVTPSGRDEDASPEYRGLSRDILTMVSQIIEIANKSGAAPWPGASKGGNRRGNIINELFGAITGEDLIPTSVRSPVLHDYSEMKEAIIDKLDYMCNEDKFGDEKLKDVYNVMVNHGEVRSDSDIYNALLTVARYVYDNGNESDVIDDDPKILWAIEEIVAEYFMDEDEWSLDIFRLMCARDRILHNIDADKGLFGKGDAKDYYALGRIRSALSDIEGAEGAFNLADMNSEGFEYALARGITAHCLRKWGNAQCAYEKCIKKLREKTEKTPVELWVLKLAQLLLQKAENFIGIDGVKYEDGSELDGAEVEIVGDNLETHDRFIDGMAECISPMSGGAGKDPADMFLADLFLEKKALTGEGERGPVAETKKIAGAKYVEDAGMKMFKELTASSCLKHPCVIGVVVKARPEDKVDEVLARDFVKVVESLGAKIEKKTLLAKGIAEYQTENVKYVVYVDDGTANGENISRLKEFKGVLEKNGASGNTVFSWILNKKSRAGNNEYSSCLGSLSEISYLMGLEGDYCPVSWQIIVAPLIVNLIDSKNELERNTGADAGWRKAQEERIDAIVKSIVNCVKLMTDENYGTFIKEVGGDLSKVLFHMTIKDLRRFMNGSLSLPLAIKSSVAIEECRKMDAKVLRAV